MNKELRLRIAIAVLALTLSACGFQLRGTSSLPFETLYIPKADAGIALDLKRYIQSGSRTVVVNDPKSAEAQLELTGETKVHAAGYCVGGKLFSAAAACSWPPCAAISR